MKIVIVWMAILKMKYLPLDAAPTTGITATYRTTMN